MIGTRIQNPSVSFLPIRTETIAGQIKIWRDRAAKKNAARNVKRGREGGRRSWQRGRVYDSALYAKGERGDSETRYYPTVLLPWRPARRRAADVDGRPAPASSTGHFRTVKRQRRVSLFFFFLLFLLRRWNARCKHLVSETTKKNEIQTCKRKRFNLSINPK